MNVLRKSIKELLKADLEVIEETNNSHDISGYVFIACCRSVDKRTNGAMYVYDSEDYISLIGLLEPIMLDLKMKVAKQLSRDMDGEFSLINTDKASTASKSGSTDISNLLNKVLKDKKH